MIFYQKTEKHERHLSKEELDQLMKIIKNKIEVREPYKKDNELYFRRTDDQQEIPYLEANPDNLRHGLTNYEQLLRKVKKLQLSYNDQEALIYFLKHEATRKVQHQQSQKTRLWMKEVKETYAQEIKKLKQEISNLTQQISNLTQQISNFIQENLKFKDDNDLLAQKKKEQDELIKQKDEAIEKLKSELEAVKQKSEQQREEFEKDKQESEKRLQYLLDIERRNYLENEQTLDEFDITDALYLDDSFYSGEDDEQLDAANVEVEDIDSLSLEFDENSTELEQDVSSNTLQPAVRSRSQDLVRLYLQEIGRVPLLSRDEEVAEAQRVQRYMQLLELRTQAAQTKDGIMRQYVELMDLRDRLAAKLGHKPSPVRWARDAKLDVAELKKLIAVGKAAWAEIADLTVEELDRIQTEGIRAKEHMIKANLRLVVSVAKKYQNRGLELLDLVLEGTLGLERSVDNFDPTKGYRFSTYAYWWIRQGITRAIATQSRTIRLPVHITEKLNKIKKAQRKLSQEKGRTPSIDDIARELGNKPSEVREVLLRVPRSISLETKVGKEKDIELADLLETNEISPEDLLVRESLQRDLKELLADLSSRERDVIEMRFGLFDGHPYSLSDVGKALDLSRERVRQIEAKALQKLRQPKRRNRVQDYLESLT